MASRSLKHMTGLPDRLSNLRKEVEAAAKKSNLDFFEVIFEVLDWNQLNEVASYGGFPNRYPHWRFGMEYERLSKSYSYGLSKIYEMVINNDPCYAYLLYSNSFVDQKLVMAHVYAHCDFFKNNVYFAHTNRKMMDEMANHRTKILKYMDRFGYDEVERFIDCCLSVENLIDYNAPVIRKKPSPRVEEESLPPDLEPVKRFRVDRPYMDSFVNPPEFIAEQKAWQEEQSRLARRFPETPEKDVMLFLLDNSPLRSWERDVLSLIREEACYFAPQGQTKILNEGWAVYNHSKILTTMLLGDDEIIDYADRHSGTLSSSGRLNPYKIGYELFKDIEDRWNKGKFGRDYLECTSMAEKKKWDKKLGLGRKKVFEVRRLYNDITFIDEFLTPEFCQENKMFVYAYDYSTDKMEIVTDEFSKVKEQLLFQLTNMFNPIIYVVDGNYKNNQELLLEHKHEGIDLRIDFAKETLKNIYRLWQKPVNIETVVEGSKKTIGYDGSSIYES